MSEPAKASGMERRLIIAISIVIGTTLLVGAIQGKLTRRWGMSADVTALGAQLESLSTDAVVDGQGGEWQMTENSRLEPVVIDVLECVGHIKRTYVHRQTGESVNVAVMLGPPGPIAVHTPEVCYSSQNYRFEQSRERVEISTAGGRSDSFWSLTLGAKDPGDNRLRVYYAWTSGGPWQASERPRFEFSGRSCLYKIQLASLAPPAGAPESKDGCRRFLEAFIPALDRALLKAEL
jgi:hypothetical protein